MAEARGGRLSPFKSLNEDSGDRCGGFYRLEDYGDAFGPRGRADEVLGLDIVPPKLNLDIFGKANKIVHPARKNCIGGQAPDSRVQPFRCFAEYSGENKPAFRNGGNRQTGIQETALAA